MTWAVLDDFLARFNRDDNPELTQLTAAPGGAADEELLQAALDEADALMRGMMAGRALPGSDQDLNLRRIQCDLARWTLYRDAVPDRVQQLYEADVAQLKAIAAGLQTAGDTTGPESGGDAVQILVLAPNQIRGF
jgi:phage gp36-like protein